MNTRIRRFRKILSARERWRDEERKRLAEERKAEDAIRLSLDTLHEERKDALRDFSAESGRICSCMDLWFRRQVVDAVEKNISERNSQLSSIREQISGTETRLKEKHRDVRIMETFIGNLIEEDRTNNARCEQEELDDFAGIRFQDACTEDDE